MVNGQGSLSIYFGKHMVLSLFKQMHCNKGTEYEMVLLICCMGQTTIRMSNIGTTWTELPLML